MVTPPVTPAEPVMTGIRFTADFKTPSASILNSTGTGYGDRRVVDDGGRGRGAYCPRRFHVGGDRDLCERAASDYVHAVGADGGVRDHRAGCRADRAGRRRRQDARLGGGVKGEMEAHRVCGDVHFADFAAELRPAVER